MSVIVVESIQIAAEPDHVFAIVSEPHRQAAYVPAVQKVEYVSGSGFEGLGTRIRETRMQGNATLVTELEVVEYDAAERTTRMVADTHGTIWDTRITVAPDRAGCTLTMAMDARGSTWMKRLMNRLMRGFFRRGIQSHLRVLRDALGEAA